MAFIEARGVTKSFPVPTGTRHVLRDVNLSVEQGSFVCIVGAMGSGKSTLLGLLAGLTTPDTAYHIGKDVQVGDHHVKDAFRHDEIDITTRGILVKSSNVGAITAARSMDPDVLRDYMVRFGLGQSTTLGLPGEAWTRLSETHAISPRG